MSVTPEYFSAENQAQAKVCLLIDDDADDREIFKYALAEVTKPIQLVIAANGKEALQQLSAPGAQIPDYIFLDLNMPFLSGIQVLQELKSIAHLKNIPVYIYSTSSQEKDRVETTALGAAAFITKPYNAKYLVKILSNIF